MDENQRAAAELVSASAEGCRDAERALVAAMWEAKQQGVSSNEIARRVEGIWSRVTALDVLDIAAWSQGVHDTLTAAGVALGKTATDDVYLLPAARIRQVGLALSPARRLAPIPYPTRGEDESRDDYVARALAYAEAEWAESARSLGEKVVPPLLAAGYQIGAFGHTGPLSEAEAIVAFTRDVTLHIRPA
ncbi:hypothetical protein [Nocardia sp. NPDC050435]|uniref:hypothetical protein n=1 Tax=Nocardia sp. NPDC050435 TaxID=3155040 RepID=UPI0033EC447B